MVGFWDDVPAPKIPYHADGSFVGRVGQDFNITLEFTPTESAELNDNSDNAIVDSSAWTLVIFSHLKDVKGIFFGHHDQTTNCVGSFTVQTSVNSTNGTDGDWVTRSTTLERSFRASMPSQRRQSPTSSPSGCLHLVDWAGVQAVRAKVNLTGNRNIYVLHLYGFPSEGSTPQTFEKLRVWHPTADEPLDDDAADGPYFDWGNAARDSEDTRTFRIKNVSSSLADTVVVSTEIIPNDSTPSFAGQHLYSTATLPTFTTTKDVGNIASGGISEVITVKLDVDPAVTLNTYEALIKADATGGFS
jgi:hypothetical protein